MSYFDVNLQVLTKDELIEEVRYLRQEVGASMALTEVSAVSSLGIPPRMARLLLALYQAKGRVLSPGQLLDAMKSEGESKSSVTVAICDIRKALGREREIIINRPGFGYCIGKDGRTIIEQVREGLKVAA